MRAKAAVEERFRFLVRDDVKRVAADGVDHQVADRPHGQRAALQRTALLVRVHRMCFRTAEFGGTVAIAFIDLRRHPHRAEHGNADAVVAQIF